MSDSKFIKANEKIAEGVTSGFKKIEDGVVGAYKKVEDAGTVRRRERRVVPADHDGCNRLCGLLAGAGHSGGYNPEDVEDVIAVMGYISGDSEELLKLSIALCPSVGEF